MFSGLRLRRSPSSLHNRKESFMKNAQEMKALPLDLEVREIERRRTPGCSGGGSSSTSPHCTCPVVFPPDPMKK
jgi:hypothetical protein